jgi:tetratricopeptide (TPR) repeat protein
LADNNSTGRTESRTTLRQRLGLIFFGVALFAVLLTGVEAVLSLARIGEAYRFTDLFVGFAPGQKLFEHKTASSGKESYVTRPEKLRFFNRQEFPARKDSKTVRIFCLGGSTTNGRPYDHRVSFSNWLQLYLSARDPSRNYEVINVGAISYASYRVLILMKELIEYSPDFFVVYTGHNEFLEERSYPDLVHQNPALLKARIWLNKLRSYSLLRHAWLELGDRRSRDESSELSGEVTAILDDWSGLDLYERDDALREAVVTHFETNLRQMVTLADSNRADIVFVRPISNLKDFSPFKSQHSDGITLPETLEIEGILESGRQLLEDGQAEEALDTLLPALERDPLYADLHFSIGESYLALQRFDAAHAAFLQAKDLDIAPLRALESISELVRVVALDTESPLIDLPQILGEKSTAEYGHPIMGNEYLLDHVHPGIPVHSLVAEEIMQIMDSEGLLPPNPSWSPEIREEIFRRELSAVDQEYYAERDFNLGKVLGWAGKLKESEAAYLRAEEYLGNRPELQLNLGIIYEKTHRYEQAIDRLNQALKLSPSLAEAYFNLGVVHGRLGQIEEGIEALQNALRLQEDFLLARYTLAVLLRRQGNAEEALEILQEVALTKAETPEVCRQFGLAYRDLERWQEAAAQFEHCFELDPTSYPNLVDLGICYREQGDLESAADLFGRALEFDPEYTPGLVELGRVYSRMGRLEESMTAYSKAVELNPNDHLSRNNLGILYGRLGNLNAARREFTAAIETNPEYADSYFNLGIVFENGGQPRMARSALTRALELDPQNGRYHSGLGAHYYSSGEISLAQHHFRRAQELGAVLPPEVEDTIRGLTE